MCQHAHARMSQSPIKHLSTLMHVSYTGKQMSLGTQIGMVTPWWLCTQYDMNMHLWQMPWAHAYVTRSRSLMAREGCSRSHKSPSYKVHDHPHTRSHIYIYIYTHASCIILSHRVGKIYRHCQRPKGLAQQGTGNVKPTLPYLRNTAQARSKKDKGYKERGEP